MTVPPKLFSDSVGLVPQYERQRNALRRLSLCRYIFGSDLEVAAQWDSAAVSPWTEGIPTNWKRS